MSLVSSSRFHIGLFSALFFCGALWSFFAPPAAAEEGDLEFSLNYAVAPVPEGGALTLKVGLTREPDADVQFQVARVSGDTDLWVQTAGVLTIPKATWSTAVDVILAASADADNACGRAVFRVSEVSSEGLAPVDVLAVEVDSGATTAVGGTISGHVVWNDTSQAYLITSTVVVPEGHSLTIAEDVVVRHENNAFSAFQVEGTLAVEEDCVLLLRTRASWSEGIRRHAIIVAATGAASFTDCAILTTETDDYSNHTTVGYWAAALRATAGTQVSLKGTVLQSMNTISNYRTGHGALLEGAGVVVRDDVRILGFRVGLHQYLGDVQQDIARLTITQCELPFRLSGTAVRDVTLESRDVALYGDVTVEVTATLTLAPDSRLVTGEGERLVVKGRMVATDNEVVARSRAFWNLNERRHVIYFVENGSGVFERTDFRITEMDSGYANHGDSNFWAAVLYAESGATLTVRGCKFLSTNAINNYRVGYGLRVEGATLEVADSGAIRTKFEGFRVGLYQMLSARPQEVAVCDFSDCQYNAWISGDVVRDQTLRNTGTHLVGHIVVGPTSTLELLPGSGLHKDSSLRLTVYGRITGTSAEFLPGTRAHWNLNDRRHGLYLLEGGRAEFENCAITCTEVDGYANDNDTTRWAAAIYSDATSQVVISGCSFVSTNTINNYRTGYAVITEAGEITLGDGGGAPTSIAGFRCGIRQEFGSRPQHIGLFQPTDLQVGMYLAGEVVSDVTLVNRGLRMVGNVTVRPTATLQLMPETDLYVPGYSLTLLVQGALAARDATLTLETRAHWDGNNRRNGIWFRNGGRCDLEGCAIVATEYDGYANDGNSDYWAGALYGDSSATLRVRACRFISTRAQNNWPVGYGVRLEGASAEIAGGAIPNSMQGFRTGVLQIFSANPQDIETLALTDTPWGVRVRGTLASHQTLRNGNMLMDRDISVSGNHTLSIAPDSYFYTNGYLLSVDAGSAFSIDSSTMEIWRQVHSRGVLSATDCAFIVRTNGHSNANDRYYGFELRNSSLSSFRNCSFYTTEIRTTGDTNQWSALFYPYDTARLTLEGCYVTNAPSAAGHYTRQVVRSWTQGALTLVGNVFTGNYIVLQVEAIPGQVLIRDNDFHDNVWAIINNTQPRLQARENWWGSPSGPTHVENPGGTGDRVSDRVDYGQSLLSEPRQALTVLDPLAGQELSNLISFATQPGVELIGLRIEPFASPVDQIAFRLSARSGIEWSDVSNYRLVVDANGNGTIDPGETEQVGGGWQGGADGTTFIVRFSGSFVSHADATPAYILVADFVNIEAGDRVTVAVDPSLTRPGTLGQGVAVGAKSVTHVAGAAVQVADALGGQVADALNGYTRQNGAVLFAFRFVGAVETVRAIEFSLSDVANLARGNFVTASLYHDANGNGQVDAGEARIGGATEISFSGSTGKLVFGAPFTTDAQYLLVANLRGLVAGSRMTVHLTGDKIQTESFVLVHGGATPVTHEVDMPYSVALAEVWNKPTHFGQQINQANFPLLGVRILPLGRTAHQLSVRLSSVVGITAGDLSNVKLYWDQNDNGVLDAGEPAVSGPGVVEITGNQGRITFTGDFIVRGNYIVAADFSTLANGDEITVSMDSSDLWVPEGYVVTGAIAPPLRYVVQQGIPDSRTRNQRWTLSFRSPGGTSANGRFNNAGDKVIVGYDTGSAWIYDAYSNTPLMMLKDHYDRVEYAGFSSDDSAAITVTRDGAVYIWDLATGSQRSSMFSDLLVTYAVPSPDFGKLMVITEGKGILLDIDNEQRLWEFVPGQATVNAIAYSPNGQYVLIGSSDRRAYLLDAITGVEVRRYIGHSQAVTAVAFTGDGSKLMTSSTDAVVQLWETDNGQPLGGPPLATISLQGQQSQGAAVSRDGSRVAMVSGTGNNALLRIFNDVGLELFAVNINDKSGGNWTGSLDTLTFDSQGERVIVTSGSSSWGRTASFRVNNGDYLVSWGPQGRFWNSQDGRPRMSEDGTRLFVMTDWGLNVMATTMEKPILRSPNMPGDRGFAVSGDGGKVAWFTPQGSLRVDAVADTGFSALLDRAVGANNYHAITMSPGGDMVIGGDRLFSAHTGELLANYALPDREARSAFSPDSTLWGFAIPADRSLVTMRTSDRNATLFNLMLTDPYMPYKMLYFPDNKRIAAVAANTGMQVYDMTTDLPVGLYRFAQNSDVALSRDGTLLLMGGTNTVQLMETKTGRVLRYFYPQHSSIQNVGVHGVQFAADDSLIMIGWSYNYVETYQRTLAAGLEVSPAARTLAGGESQAFHVDVIYDDGTRSDVTPSSADPERAVLQIEPPAAAAVSGNVVTVAADATGTFVVRALYREGNNTFTAEALVTIGQSRLVELVASPARMTVVPGVFRDINYLARYDDGYETDVTTLVSLVSDRPADMVVAGQAVKVNLTAIPGDFLVTGSYTDSHNDTRQAVTTVTMFGPKTAWERYRVTGGGYGLSGDFSPNGQKFAWGSGSGAINVHSVGLTPSQYPMTQLIPAHEGPIFFLDYINNDKMITVGGDGTIAVWDFLISSVTPVTRYYHDAPITAAALSGGKLAFGDSLGNVGVYDYPSDSTDWVKPFHEGKVTAIAVDTDTILSGGDDRRVKIIKRSDGTQLHNILRHTRPILNVGFMGATKFFILGEDNSLSFWRKSDYEILDSYDYPAQTTYAEYIGNQLYVSTNNPVATWIYNSDGLLLRWLEHPPAQGKVSKYLIDPSGKYILTGRSTSKTTVETFFGSKEVVSPFSAFQFWEVGRGIFRGSLAHSHPVSAAFVSGDAAKIFTQSPKRTMAWHFDVAGATVDGRVLLETGYFIAPSFAGMDFTADTRILATRVDVSIYMFDTFTNLLWKTLHTPGGGPFAISPDGSRMASSDFRTRLWDLGNLSMIREEPRVASALDFRGNSHFLGAIAADSFVAIFNPEGLFFNGFATTYPPAHLFVNSLGTRAAVVTVKVEGDMLEKTYIYYLEVFDISNIAQEPPRVTPPIYLLTTKEDIFGEGEGQVGFRLAVSEDTALALVGPEGDRPVKLVNLNDGSTIREFLPPGGAGENNLGAAAVGFTDNDDSVMIAWKEGFAELHRRVRPNDLDLLVHKVESGKPGQPAVERFLARLKTGGVLYVEAGATYSTESIAQYANGAQLNVTSTAGLVSDNTPVAAVSGRYVTIAPGAPDGAVVNITATYDELGDELTATVRLKVGEPPRLPGDLNLDGKVDKLDLFLFSMWWMQPDIGTGTSRLANLVNEDGLDEINAQDLLELIKWYHGELPPDE